MQDSKLAQIEALVKETFDLWDIPRVGFRWKAYNLNHTYRVTNLSVQMGKQIDADTEKLRCAGILHDITKPYDGDIKMGPDGKRIVNEEGFWMNEMVKPNRSNWVTELYDKLNLYGTIHHVSGAVLTEIILKEFGFPEGYAKEISEIVRGHLKPSNLTPDTEKQIYRLPETRLLYDADTIDPNLGFTAFYRNIQITMGRYIKGGGQPDLKDYVQRIAVWVDTKDVFISHLLTDIGKEIAAARQQRNRDLSKQLLAELDAFELNCKYGLLGVVAFLMTEAENPSLHRHAERLRTEWLPQREATLHEDTQFSKDAAQESLARARTFSALLDQEIAGKL